MKKFYLLLLVFVLAYAPACKKSDAGGGGNPVDTTHPSNPVTETGLLTWMPPFPTDTGAITITLDASKGNAGLKGYGGDVYIYTGVVTDQSNGGWKYVASSSFNSADPKSKTTSLGNDKYQITLKPRSFYNVPAGEKILKLALLFRNTDGSLVARNTDGSDMFINIYDASKLQVRFTSPEFAPKFTPEPVLQTQMNGDEISVSAVSSQSSSLTISLNGSSFATASNTTTVSGKTKLTVGGTQTVKVTAVANGQTAEATYTFVSAGTVEIAALPSGAKDGVTFINNGTSAIFNIYAPDKKFGYVIGDFTNWQADPKYFMKKTPDGTRWWVQVDNLDANKYYTYQYLVDGTLKVADPYCELILDPDNDKYIGSETFPNMPAYPIGKATGIVSVTQANPQQYNWQVSNFTRPDKKDLVIYELHVRDFIGAHNYQTLKDTLTYLTRLGVNAVELMPVTEFEGNSSWGYNPDFYFAADKYYGPKTSLQAFIDECHKKGIAVVLDMVLNHSFGQSPMVQLYFDGTTQKPAANSPWFNVNPTHPYNVGYDFNHESAATKYFVKNVLQFWMQQYKVDGFRFDLSKGFTENMSTNDADFAKYDATRVAIWKEYNNFIKGIDPNFYVILEHFAVDMEEQALSAEGMMLWNNLNYNFNQATMGYTTDWDFSRIFYDKHGFTQPYNLVTYMESHDEERLQYKNEQYGNSSGAYNVKDLATGLKRQQMAAAFLFSSPGPKMIWEFGEVGYDVSINQGDRTGEKPPHWEYQGNPDRQALYNVFAKMIRLKTKNAVFATSNFQYGLNTAVKYIKLNGTDANVVVVGNFDVSPQTANITFPSSGTWYDCLTGATITLGSTAYTATLTPGEYHVYSSKVLNQ
ncbi:alpha-amylase family glycosyl hydrolase [Chitinophagaceae bacterium 26-R-25]|nr:alpha-amylase family glycosyl hydrolase [Chitinophagaceae bacterium 26-R-25]